MKTIVYQSYRTHDVAPWLQRCMLSVREWSVAQGHEYRFVDDSLFDRVPESYRAGVRGGMLPLTNLARLLVARELLDEGFDRTIWMDADVLVFDPARFRIGVERDFAFCRQVWMSTRWRAPVREHGVNNAVTVFVRGNRALDFFIWAHERLAELRQHIYQFGTTTRMLTAISAGVPLPTLDNVAILSPAVAQELLAGGGPVLRDYVAAHAAPTQAINLTASMRDQTYNGITLRDADFERIVVHLLDTRGALLQPAVPGQQVS